MALSDTCHETVSELANAFKNYAEDGYPTRFWNAAISTMFTLSELAAELDIPPMMSGKNSPHWIANHIVLELLLKDDDQEQISSDILNVLAEAAKNDPRLGGAVIEMYKWAKSPDGIEYFLKTNKQIAIRKLYNLMYPNVKMDE